MWGTWWAWDPRLTSFLILFLFYLGYIALWAGDRGPGHGGRPDLGPVPRGVGLCGAVSRYAVNFWNQGLHQGASLSLDKEENVADVFWLPLLVCIAGFVLLFVALVLLRTRTEIRARRLRALRRAGADGVMPDLGKYAVAVLSAYGVSILLSGGDRGVERRRGRGGSRRELEERRRGSAMAKVSPFMILPPADLCGAGGDVLPGHAARRPGRAALGAGRGRGAALVLAPLGGAAASTMPRCARRG